MPPKLSSADARLEFAIRHAEEAGDLYAWLLAVQARYGRAQERQVPASELAEMRDSIWRRADALRAQYRSRGARLWVGQVVEQMMGPLFRDEFAAGNVTAARMLEMMESVKSRTLLDQMRLGFKELPTAELQQQAMTIEREMTFFAPDPNPDVVLSEIRLTSQLPLEDRSGASRQKDLLQAVESIYSQAGAGFSGVQTVCSLQEIQQALEPREALIEYAIPFHFLHPAFHLHTLVVTATGAFQSDYDLTKLPGGGFTGKLRVDDKQPMDASPLGEIIVKARTAIRTGEDVEADTALQQLHAILIAPLIQQGLNPQDFDRWIIVPHRLLHSIPWAALCDGDARRLIEDVAIVVAPSASVWHALVTRAPVSVNCFLALANPRPLPDPSLPSLEQAETEADKIGELLVGLQSVVLKREDATESALRKLVAGKSIVHFATHGEFPLQDALDFHQLLLAAGEGNDGRVRAEELRKMDFRCASLVALSICNGGIYRFGPGDEPYGLSPAFLAAGANNLLGTLWSIEDWVGRQFVVEFYSNLLRCGPAEALRLASNKYFQQGLELRQWAAFVTVGSGRKLTGQGSTSHDHP